MPGDDNSPKGTYVDVDGKQVLLEGDYSIGPLGWSDIFAMARPYLNKLLLARQNDYQEFLYKLKKGETSAIIITFISFCLATWLAIRFLSILVYGWKKTEKEEDTKIEKETEDTKKEEEKVILKDFTIEGLRSFNGVEEEEIYIALVGDVYNVTSSKEYYGPQGPYHIFSGHDASRAMAKFSLTLEDVLYPDISQLNPFEKEMLEDWIDKFKYYKQYPIIGRLSSPIIPHSLEKDKEDGLAIFQLTDLTTTTTNTTDTTGTATTRAERPSSGRLYPPLYLALNGLVYDVSYHGGYELYGPDGPYSLFVGKDVSRAFAKMSFSEEDLNQGHRLDDLTETEKKTMLDWEKKFKDKRKYPVVGKLAGSVVLKPNKEEEEEEGEKVKEGEGKGEEGEGEHQ